MPTKSVLIKLNKLDNGLKVETKLVNNSTYNTSILDDEDLVFTENSPTYEIALEVHNASIEMADQF